MRLLVNQELEVILNQWLFSFFLGVGEVKVSASPTYTA